MSPQKNQQYKAYVKATNTVAKTRQVVMLYDGVLRFLKQTVVAIQENRIEERYNLTVKISEILAGLQGSIDFENGGDIAGILHGFYTGMLQRVISLNFIRDKAECEQKCNGIIEEIKQMRDIWNAIDQSTGSGSEAPIDPSSIITSKPSDSGVTISA